VRDSGWTRYSEDDQDAIETAYTAGKAVCALGVYRINLREMVQYRAADESRQRPVRRVVDRKRRLRGDLVGESVFVVYQAGDAAADDCEIVGVYASRESATAKKRSREAKIAPGSSKRVFVVERAIKP
jgi:hypothetical protein